MVDWGEFIRVCPRAVTSHFWLAAARGALLLLVAAPVSGQDTPPLPQFNLAPPPMNSLVAISGPEFGSGEKGIGRYSGFAYERKILRLFLIRLDFGQSYNGEGTESYREYFLGSRPVGETVIIDLNRLMLGGHIGITQRVGRMRALIIAGPSWTRVGRSRRVFLTDLRTGISEEVQRDSEGAFHGGFTAGGGIETDIADQFAWRLMVLHNHISVDPVTSIGLGGAIRF